VERRLINGLTGKSGVQHNCIACRMTFRPLAGASEHVSVQRSAEMSK